MSRCWAYNIKGDRCELDAGHDSPHMVATVWNDDECFDPTKTQQPTKTLPPIVKPSINIDTPPAQPSRCVACNHQHKGGECKCGCYEYIG